MKSMNGRWQSDCNIIQAMGTPAEIPEQPERKGIVPMRVYWPYWAALGLTVLVTLLAFLFGVRNSRHAAPTLAQNDARTSHAQSPFATYSMSGRGSQLPLRPLLPYSVVPGGVHSAQELKDAVAHDAVVANLYANFDLAKAHIIRLKRNRTAYVSYRFGDRVYWTKKKLTLVKGERIITDGKHEARTRCGNVISEAPSQPVSPREPSEEAMEAVPTLERFDSGDPGLDLPPISPPTLVPPQQTSPEDPAGWGVPPPVFPIVGGGSPPPPAMSPPPPPINPPPVATPEPGTLALLMTGVLASLLFWLLAEIRRKRRA
jgi:hypothetical protein